MEKKMSRAMMFLFLSGMIASHMAQAAEPLRAGVLEFDEKNDIGLQNAKQIVPEYLISHLKTIGVYRLVERMEIEKALKEQEFQMTGVVDDATAVQIGKLVGLQAIIFGSVMKVGDTITISGRVINAETSDVIAAGSVEFSSLKEIDANMEKLAYLLSGIGEGEYRSRKMEQLISRRRFGLRLGTGMSLNYLDMFTTPAFSPLAVGAFFQSRYFDGEFFISPLSGATTVSALISVDPFVHFGFGVGYQFTSDSSANTADRNAYYGQYQAVLLGVTYRASDILRASLYVGAAFAGYVQYWPKDPTYTAQEYYYNTTLSLGAAAFTMELHLSEAFSLMLALYGNGGDAVIDHKLGEDATQPNTYGDRVYMGTYVLSLMAGYSFSF